MDTGNGASQPQARAPRSRLTWIWPVITDILYLSAVGCMLSALLALSNHLPVQVIGSGWWQDGAWAFAGLLYALVGFSGKISALVTRRKPAVLWLKLELLDLSMEALGLTLFFGLGVLPLCIHDFDLLWGLGFLWGVLLIVWLIRQVKLFKREVTTQEHDRNDVVSLIADPSRLSRRALISSSLILATTATGLAAVWRTWPTLIPDYTFFGHDGIVRSLSWFPDGRRIASTGGKGEFSIWNADNGSNRRTSPLFPLELTNLRVSPDGRFIAAGDDTSMWMLDAATTTVLWKKDLGYSVRPFSWAPDSSRVVMLHGYDVRIVDAATGSEATTLFISPGNFSPYIVACSPNGTLIAATDGNQLLMWDASSGVQRKTFTLGGPTLRDATISDLAWSPDGDALAFAKENTLIIWFLRDTEIEEGMGVRKLGGDVPAFSWSPDGRYIAFCVSEEKTVHILEVATSETVFVYNGHFSTVEAVAWSPDGRRIASGGYDHLVHVWRPILPA